MNDASTRTGPPGIRTDLRSFLRDWALWSPVERRAATLFVVFVAVAPVAHFLP
ncbi:MAG TPA: hypothetical protein VD978_31600 [Azospirillum sp.]|nr:hypothetical protein [Azospirillum sp.]